MRRLPLVCGLYSSCLPSQLSLGDRRISCPNWKVPENCKCAPDPTRTNSGLWSCLHLLAGTAYVSPGRPFPRAPSGGCSAAESSGGPLLRTTPHSTTALRPPCTEPRVPRLSCLDERSPSAILVQENTASHSSKVLVQFNVDPKQHPRQPASLTLSITSSSVLLLLMDRDAYSHSQTPSLPVTPH